MTRVLIVDDDKSIRDSLSRALEQCGYEVICAADGLEALAQFTRQEPDATVLDIMMPGMNGYDTIERIREQWPEAPVIMLSAKGDIVDKTVGFRAGADDYMTKPFSVEELILRIEAILRRFNRASNQDEVIRIGNLEVHPRRYEAFVNGNLVNLTAREFELLAFMARSEGQVFSRRQLYSGIWGDDIIGDGGIVAVYVRKIREQIEEDPKRPQHLVTVWGIGYKLV